MTKLLKPVVQHDDTNGDVITVPEHTIPNISIMKMTHSPEVGNSSETTIIENRETPNILSSKRSTFSSIDQNYFHRRVVSPSFYSQTNITTVSKMASLGVR